MAEKAGEQGLAFKTWTIFESTYTTFALDWGLRLGQEGRTERTIRAKVED